MVYKNSKKMREVRGSMVGITVSILCHGTCLGLDDADIIFYVWLASIVAELVLDVISRLKYVQCRCHSLSLSLSFARSMTLED